MPTSLLPSFARPARATSRARRLASALVLLPSLVAGLCRSAAADEDPPASLQVGPDQPAKRPRDVAPTPQARPVGLDEAVRRALDRNPTAKAAEADFARAAALVTQARGTWLPTLTGNGTYTRLDDDRVLGDRIFQARDQVSANLSLQVPLFAPRGWVRTSQAADLRDAVRAGSKDVRRTVAVQTAKTYLAVIAQHRVLEASERAAESAKAHRDYASTRQQGGIGNRLDALRAQQELAVSEARVATQRAALARTQEALGVLVGEEAPLDASAEPTLPASGLSRAQAVTDAAVRRDDVKAARARAHATEGAREDNWAEYAPQLSGAFQPFTQNPPTPVLPRFGWQAQLLLTVPLYDGGVRYGLGEERKALDLAAKARLRALVQQAQSEVRVAYTNLERADEALEHARDAAKLAREALDLAETAYRAGATTNIEVIDAERRARDAETDAAVAEDASRQARLDVLAASGHFP